MSDTGPTPRVTRAASRARSVEADNASVAGPRVAARTAAPTAAPTPVGTRNSRRGVSPAVSEPSGRNLPQKSNRAYGTKALANPSDQLVGAAPVSALATIGNAVASAETGDLSTVNEEEEGPAADLVFQEQPLSVFSLQYWAPRASLSTTTGYIIDSEGRRRAVRIPYAPAADPRVLMWTLILVMFSMFLLVPAFQVLFHHVAPRYFPGFGGTSIQNDTQMSYEYDNLLSRIGNVEYHLKHSSQSFVPKKQINWFLPGWGAVIDPHLSSPIATTECGKTWNFWPWKSSNACVPKALSQPHMSALTAWDDPGADRWCAPRSGGKLQLTIELPRNVAPTELVVEYGARDETPEGGMGAAPKEIELWILVEDDDMRNTIGNVLTRMHPHLLMESSPQAKTLSAEQALGGNWVPIGRWIYNIRAHQNIQSFNLPISLHEYGIHTAKVAFRVNSNWGNVMFTCVNRLRLHGKDVTGIFEELEEYPREVKA